MKEARSMTAPWVGWVRRSGGPWTAVTSGDSEAAANREAEEVRRQAPWASCPRCEWTALPTGVKPGSALRAPKRPASALTATPPPAARKRHRRR
jgi:hypothetical protein